MKFDDNDSEKIDSVHSLKNEQAQKNDQSARKPVFAEHERSQKYEDDAFSQKSDSEPGNPNFESTPAHDVIQKKFPLKNALINQSSDLRSFNKKSVQFVQEGSGSKEQAGIELQSLKTSNFNQIQPEVPIKLRRSSAIDREIQEKVLVQKQAENYSMLHDVIDPFWSQSLTQILNFRQGKNDSEFAKMWSFLFFIVQTYNFFTAFFFIGIQGRPTDIWYLIEVVCEILQIFDFVARWVIRVHFNEAWEQMSLLHDRGGVTTFHFYIRLVASIPYQIIISIAVQNFPEVRENIWLSSLRLLKLLKFRQVIEYFNALEFQKRQQNNYSILQTLYVIYYLLCFLHVGSCFLCFIARIDPFPNDINNKGWLRQYNLIQLKHTIYDVYREAFFNNLTTSLGAAFGLIMATTNLEYFALTIWHLSGPSIVVGYFSWICAEYSLRNIKVYDNYARYEQAKKFCDQKNFPSDIRQRIRYFYQNMRINFEEYNQKTKILDGLPIKMKLRIAPIFNSKVIQQIKFFQMSNPDFVSRCACVMTPEICLTGDLIVQQNEIADKMYFVQDGSLEVLATDHFTTIAFIGAGTYFGEIGVLITGKRSLSIKALTNCLCYTIQSNSLLLILEDFPDQTQFLRAVGYQRLQTTNPQDITTQRVTGKLSAETAVNSPSIAGQNEQSKYDQDISFLRMNSMPDSKLLQNDKIRTKPWLTDQYNDIDYFIIMPFSNVFYFWNLVMFLAFNYVFFMVWYGIGFKKDIGFNPLLIVCQVIFALDIPIRMRTGIVEPKHISTDLKKVFTYYINTWLFYDMLASVPIEYVLQVYYPEISRWILVLKFFKIGRLYETIQIYIQNTNFGLFNCMFTVYIYLMVALSHIGACLFCLVCEMNPYGSSRYDGKSWLSDYINLPQNYGDPNKYSPSKKYAYYWYASSAFCCGNAYADIYCRTDMEIYVCLTIVSLGRVILAFALTDSANLLGEIFKRQQRNLMSTSYLNQWMEKIKLPQDLIKRVRVFNQMQLSQKNSIDEDEILEGLPPSLIKNTKNFLFAPLIRTCEAISKGNVSEFVSIIEQLELVTFPENEFIIKVGEVAEDMYFIVEGLCEVISADGKRINVLKQGQNFGEMALLDQNMPMRLASVRTLTNVQIAKLNREGFEVISELYPQFKENIVKMVQTRLKQLLNNKHAQSSTMREQIILKLQASESLSLQSSNLSDSLTDSDFDEEIAKMGYNENDSIYIFDQNDNNQLEQQLIQISERENISSPQAEKRRQFLRNGIQQENQNKITEIDAGEAVHTERKLISNKQSSFRRPKMQVDQKQSRNRIQPYDDSRSANSKKQASSHNSNNSKLVSSNENARSLKEQITKKNIVRSQTQRMMANLAEMSQQQSTQQQLSNSKSKILNWKNLYKIIIWIVVHYNFWFIPIQTAFKFQYSKVYLALECITLATYAFELVYRVLKHRHLTKISKLDEASLSLKDRKLRQDYDKMQSKIAIQKLEFLLTLIAIIPLNFIFQTYGWYQQNIWLDILVMSLRLVKYRQLSKIFELIAPYNLAIVRVLQTLYYNYVICNYFCCIFIDLAIWEPDARYTWLRRTPVNALTFFKWRQDPDWRTDQVPWQIYVSAQYYIQATFSNVCIGDLVTSNESEWWFNSIYQLSNQFIYVYLFANIASIVSNLQSEIQLQFLKRKFNLLQKMQNKKIPKFVLNEIDLYFQYQFYKYNGQTEKEMTEKLPDRIKLDIQLSQYQTVINTCLLFRKINGELDITIANSLLMAMETHVYLSENYITKIGQIFDQSILVLEGTVNVCGYYQDENLGQLGPGDFYGTDLDEQAHTLLDKNYFQYTQGEPYPKLHLNRRDNFEKRALVHLISKTFVVVGILSKQKKKILYKAFPQIQKIFGVCNRYFFDLGRKQVEKSIWQEDHKLPTRDDCLACIKDQIAFSNLEFYDSIMRRQRIADFNEVKNLSYLVKNYFIIHQNTDNQKNLRKQIFGKVKQDLVVEQQKQGASWCCEDVYIAQNGKLKKVILYIHFFNIIYTSFALPFYISFNIKIKGAVLGAEILSSVISFFVFFLNFRTPYIENGQTSTDFWKIFKNYYKNGMVVDFIGILPLNIILDHQVNLIAPDRTIAMCCLVGLARLTRIFSAVQIVSIFDIIKLSSKQHRDLLQAIGNIMFCIVVTHWICCSYMFLILVIEQHDKTCYYYGLKVNKMSLLEAYNFMWYTVINITSGAGQGDVHAESDLERIYYLALMNCGDIIFAFAFGLINQIALQTRLDDETGNFIKMMVQIERSLDKFEISNTLKDQIEQFYTFQQKVKNSPQYLNAIDLENYLPQSLVKKVLYYQFRDLVRPFCGAFQSENLIAEICYCLTSRIYMPDDIIMAKGEYGDGIYFIDEGEAQIIAADGRKIIQTLQKGSFIGDTATLIGQKLIFSLKAKTFVLIKEISKADLAQLSINYPQIYEKLKERSQKQYAAQKSQIQQQASADQEFCEEMQLMNALYRSTTEYTKSINSESSIQNDSVLNLNKGESNLQLINSELKKLESLRSSKIDGRNGAKDTTNRNRRKTLVENAELRRKLSMTGLNQDQIQSHRTVIDTQNQLQQQIQNQEMTNMTQTETKKTFKRRLSTHN